MNYKYTIAFGVAGALLASTASAAETISITVVSGNAPQFSAVSAVTTGFIPTVDEILAETGNYKISWNEAYSGQIAKPRAELEAVSSGLGDVGVVISAYTPDKLPLHQISFSTPFTAQDLSVAVDAINYMVETYEPYQAEWDAFNQHYLRNSAVVDAYTLYSSIPINSLKDMKGKKFAAVGANLPWIQAAGAGAVTGEMATAYNSIQTGVYDGMLLWQQIAAALKICEPAPYALVTGAGGSATVMLTVNNGVWDRLPDEVKSAFEEGAEVWNTVNLDALVAGSEAGRALCETEYGQQTTTLPEEDMIAWAQVMPSLGKQWADRAESDGKPGHELLSAYLDYLRSNGQKLLRDWDQE
ncbi:hypothetical protein [Nitratireductor luteus]|uniref:hypothetical protein n=1 Tax=Nitratireductor luteus TaxID=2976980 RepID=UPI00224020E5|nr:hypothetical protein [Nitratireductor luteus]